MNILTWLDTLGNGAFQKPIDATSIFSDKIEVKPTFSFQFTNLQFIEQNNTYKIDGVEMTAEQKTEVTNYIDSVMPPFAWYVAQKEHLINGKHSEAVRDVIGFVPNEELASWPKQEEQARALLVDSTVSTPMIDGLIFARGLGETREGFATLVVQNADAYASAYASILGNYQAKMKLLNAATSVTQVNAITW